MRCSTNYGHAYYHCRRDVAVRCPADPIRGDVLDAWAAALFNQIQGLQPEALSDAVAAARVGRRRATSNPAQITASLDRLEKLFLWGHVPEEEYLARWRQLVELSDRDL